MSGMWELERDTMSGIWELERDTISGEILAFTLNDGKKLILCSYYRV